MFGCFVVLCLCQTISDLAVFPCQAVIKSKNLHLVKMLMILTRKSTTNPTLRQNKLSERSKWNHNFVIILSAVTEYC